MLLPFPREPDPSQLPPPGATRRRAGALARRGGRSSPVSARFVPEPLNALAVAADPTRLHVLWLLRDGAELPVGAVAAALGVAFGVAGRHLRWLRDAGVLQGRRQGHQHAYRLAE